jgi:hypothetical protein
MTKEHFELLVSEYVADPNCRPYLWISSETQNELERQLFASDERVVNAFRGMMRKQEVN